MKNCENINPNSESIPRCLFYHSKKHCGLEALSEEFKEKVCNSNGGFLPGYAPNDEGRGKCLMSLGLGARDFIALKYS